MQARGNVPGKVTVTLERGGAVVIIKEVPADVCAECGEYYLNEAATKRVFALGEEAAKRNAEVEIVKYAAA